MQGKIITKSAEETQKLALGFAQQLQGGDIVLLYGNLGAGKTTFMQGLAKSLGISHRVISPTFIIMRSYTVKNKGFAALYHADLYRLSNEAELEGTGILDVLGASDTVTCIEWPEKMDNFVPRRRWEIHIENISESEREITLEKYE